MLFTLSCSRKAVKVIEDKSVKDKYGSDPLRWYLLTVSPPWVPTRFDIEGIAEVQRKFFGTLLNGLRYSWNRFS